jgi:predicted chitinase
MRKLPVVTWRGLLVAGCAGAGVLWTLPGCSGTGPEVAPVGSVSGTGGQLPADGGSSGGAPTGCVGGLTLCNNICVDTSTDINNCGTCGRSCGAGAVCEGGTCQCVAGLVPCESGCAELASDPANCGSCGRACAPGEFCSLGQCSLSCADGLTACGSSCVDVTQSPFHCGTCFNACHGGQSCAGGTCTCPPGFSLCDGVCTNTANSASNCGACGKACPPGASCVDGDCVGGGTGGSGGIVATGGGTGGAGGSVVTGGGGGTPAAGGGTPGTGGTVATGGSGGGATMDCDNSGDCYGSCYICAIEGPCLAEETACMNSSDCAALVDCIDPECDEAPDWGDCYTQCASLYPGGVAYIEAMWDCIYCDACPVDCAADADGCGTDPPDPTGNGLADVLSAATFNSLFPNRNSFYTYEDLVAAVDSYPLFASDTYDLDTRQREVAAFLANVAQETGELEYIVELSPPHDYCDNGSAICTCAPGVQYWGRGPLQLSWNYNYCEAGIALGLDLRADPDLVARDPEVAWAVALWFWMTQNGAGSMTMHSAMVDGHGFGQTIQTINGALECPSSPQATARVNYYTSYCGVLGVDPGSNLYCP